MDLAAIGNDSVRALNELWDTIGVDTEERAAFLARVAAEIEAVYRARVGSEALRQEGLRSEIQGLQTTIADMMVSLEESVEVVRPPAARSAQRVRGCARANR